jgi:hypothetical protein
MKRFAIHDPGAGFHSVTAYGRHKREALADYRSKWYPERRRLPRNISIWED